VAPDGIETEWTHHFLICVACVSLLNEDIYTIKINIIPFLDAYKKVGLEGKTEKMKHMLSHQPNAEKITA
jgi:hypothetical protein